jgi:hypothetical protein
MTDQPSDIEKRESRVAMVGIVGCLVCTSAGMVFSSPVLGAIGLVVIVILVPFRKPIARALARG